MVVNNPTEHELEAWRHWLSLQVHAVMAKETGEQGTPHVHIVFLAARMMRFTVVQKTFPRGHIQAVYEYKGAVAYAIKEGEVEEWGSVPNDAPTGRVADERSIGAQLEALRGLDSIAEAYEVNFPLAIRYSSALLRYYAEKQRPHRTREVKVLWFYGGTGAGKSREARRLLDELYGADWADVEYTPGGFLIGYAGEKGVLFDDFRGRDMPFQRLLKLLDRYDTRVNVKGTSMRWEPETIIITCPRPPAEEYTFWRNSTEHQAVKHEDMA